jgi:hypothetical protein
VSIGVARVQMLMLSRIHESLICSAVSSCVRVTCFARGRMYAVCCWVYTEFRLQHTRLAEWVQHVGSATVADQTMC